MSIPATNIMKTYTQLKKEFDSKVEKLQRACKHPKLSGWMEVHWAIGHSTGTYIKKCEVCNKTIKKKGQNMFNQINKTKNGWKNKQNRREKEIIRRCKT